MVEQQGDCFGACVDANGWLYEACISCPAFVACGEEYEKRKKALEETEQKKGE